MPELTVAQVDALRRHEIRFRVSNEILARFADEVLADARRESALRIAFASGHPIDAEEITQYRPVEYLRSNATGFTHRWEPEQAGYIEVELHGGPRHGERVRLSDVGPEPLRTLAPCPKPCYDLSDGPPTLQRPEIIVYDYDGWNTETKRWIYRANRTV